MQKVPSGDEHSPRRPIWKFPNQTGLCMSVGRGYILNMLHEAFLAWGCVCLSVCLCLMSTPNPHRLVSIQAQLCGPTLYTRTRGNQNLLEMGF